MWLQQSRIDRLWPSFATSALQKRLHREMLDWIELAACRDMPFFTMQHPNAEDIAAAKAICAVCPVIDKCYTHAMTYPEPAGIWAGLTADERLKIRRANQRQRSRGRPPKDAVPVPIDTQCLFPGCGRTRSRGFRYCPGHTSQYYSWGEEAMRPLRETKHDDDS